MIIYFSGTGNSRFAARLLADELQEQITFLPNLIPESEDFTKKISEEKRLIFVFPIYSWGIPPIILSFIDQINPKATELLQKKAIIMICTCGDETGLAPEMLVKKLKSKGLNLYSGWSVIMPNDYVLLPGFDVDSKDIEREKLDRVKPRINEIANHIKKREIKFDYTRGSLAGLKTTMIYPLFKKWGIIPSKWHWTEECISCGKCVTACPVNNITFKGQHPYWGKNCTSCLGCYHICPVHAIEYGRSTAHKGQYFCHRK